MGYRSTAANEDAKLTENIEESTELPWRGYFQRGYRGSCAFHCLGCSFREISVTVTRLHRRTIARFRAELRSTLDNGDVFV